MDLAPVACIDMYCLGSCSKLRIRVGNRSRQIRDTSQRSHSLKKPAGYELVQDVWVRTAPPIWYSIVVHLFGMQKYIEISAWVFNKKKGTKCISKQFKFLSFQCSVRFEIQSAGKLLSTMHMLQAVSHNRLLSWRWMSRQWSLTILLPFGHKRQRWGNACWCRHTTRKPEKFPAAALGEQYVIMKGKLIPVLN
jgi:hypothetical protein